MITEIHKTIQNTMKVIRNALFRDSPIVVKTHLMINYVSSSLFEFI